MDPNTKKSFRESPHLVSQKPGDLKGIFPQNVKFPLLRTICLEEETVPQDDVVPLWGPNSFWNHFLTKSIKGYLFPVHRSVFSLHLKGQSNEIFDIQFFPNSNLPGPLTN